MDVTNADRVVFPDDAITKGEVFSYYAKVAPRMEPFLARRPLTVERYPKGLDSRGFMQKNAPEHYPADLIGRHLVSRGDGGVTTYPYIESAEGIAFFANLGVVTFHVPPATVDDMLHPDWIIWDLDPPEGRVELVRGAAHALRELLEQFGIPTVVMTSGSKGYHLRTPLTRAVGHDVAAAVARGTAALAAAAHPELMTLAFRKAERGDRVFVDWLRNAPLSTSVVPWSLRARTGAPAAVPLAWDEVNTVDPDQIGLRSVEKRFEADPWVALEPLDLTVPSEAVSEAVVAAGIRLEPVDRFRA
ncbi:MAG: non-homologous end-joining DNA ligase [Acidimicrobiia bacterium]